MGPAAQECPAGFGLPLDSLPRWQVPRMAVTRRQCLRDRVESRRLLQLTQTLSLCSDLVRHQLSLDVLSLVVPTCH